MKTTIECKMLERSNLVKLETLELGDWFRVPIMPMQLCCVVGNGLNGRMNVMIVEVGNTRAWFTESVSTLLVELLDKVIITMER